MSAWFYTHHRLQGTTSHDGDDQNDTLSKMKKLKLEKYIKNLN